MVCPPLRRQVNLKVTGRNSFAFLPDVMKDHLAQNRAQNGGSPRTSQALPLPSEKAPLVSPRLRMMLTTIYTIQFPALM